MESKELTENVSYRYFNIEESKGVITIALSNKNERNHFYYYGVAFCSPKDQFVKKIARHISLGRLLKNVNHEYYDGCYAGKIFKADFDTAFLAVMKDLYADDLIPGWARGKEFYIRGKKGDQK